ncbi:unnamed protein product [Cyclocybe aegerita]|uniref:N-acetyltransferase domain-containing protein n=1 Tax=Cyclocybe aegerita TaxID=1973307 RepID=A0A8S0W0D4_CYCAE|nr:unnamed protein product [Cyclocybe aegerita]
MANCSISRLINLTPISLDALEGICARAFPNDPAALLLTGGDPSLIGPQFRAIIAAGHLAGEVYIASAKLSSSDAHAEKDVPVAVAVWFPPRTSLWSTEEQRQLGFYDFVSKIEPVTREWLETTKYKEEIGKFFNDSISPNTDVSSWVCNAIAIDPAYQRQGIGSALIQDMVQKRGGTRSYLALCATNEKNAEWYKNRRFSLKGHIPKFTGPTGSVPVYALGTSVE